MLPIRPSSLFRSRWLALIWSAAILWSAVAFVGPADEGADADTAVNGAVDDAASLKQLQLLVGKLNG